MFERTTTAGGCIGPQKFKRFSSHGQIESFHLFNKPNIYSIILYNKILQR